MINKIIKQILFFILLLLLQVFVLNNIQFSGYVNPFVYVLFILLLPADMKPWVLLIVAFFTGLTIDAFSNTLGLHSSACVAMAFVRPFVLNIISPRDGYNLSLSLSSSSYGFKWFLTYTSITVFIHHLVLFYVEVFKLSNFFDTLLRVILSFLLTMTFILLIEFIRKGKSNRQ